MTGQALEIAAADGDAEGFLYALADEGPWPGVIFLTNIFGIRTQNQGMAQRIAEAGYAAMRRTARIP